LLSPVADIPSIAVLGVDAYLAARPATAIQLAHACQAAGFGLAIPASWGDEIIALECARQLATRSVAPAVFCACERVRRALDGPGPELAPFIVSFVAPPVATARYLRRLYGDAQLDITYVGDCPSGRDPVIDRQIAPATFLADLTQRGIIPTNEPTVVHSLFAPDRRRCFSRPGGVPTDDLLRGEGAGARTAELEGPVVPRHLVEITGDDYAADLVQHLLLDDPVLLDLGPRLGCVCAGGVPAIPPARARSAVAELEPPRAPHPIVDGTVDVALSPAPAPTDVASGPAANGREAPLTTASS
jgi:hypothetical protein